jgi:isochorismate pyruvate lyase
MSSGDLELAKLRAEIDRVDSELVRLLAERIQIVDQVVDVKEKAGLPALIPDRVEEVAQRVRDEAKRLGAPPELAEHVWRQMMQWIIAYEEKRLKGGK